MTTMTDDQAGGYRSGYVAVMGRPNVGKSTLINALIGQKIAAVSHRSQTTRRRQLGILTSEDTQIIFIDTPGIHMPRHKLGEKMNLHALESLADSDVVLFLVDASVEPQEEDRLLVRHLHALQASHPIILALNKKDLVDDDVFNQRLHAYASLIPEAHPIAISATKGTNLSELIGWIRAALPEGLPLFAEEQVTDLYEREITADLIREACLNELRAEIPHGIEVRVDQFIERAEQGAYIEATIFVERESHKGIVIGLGGRMIKQIGERARREIERMSERKVYLRLRVKVRKNWRDDEKILRWFGY